MRIRLSCVFAAAFAAALGTGTGFGATLKVGAGERYAQPRDAAAAAWAGDTILIAAGRYADCAIWKASGLTIAAEGEVIIDGEVCGGKALFVIDGDNVTVRGITFAHARADDGNGAGIRGEGGNLTIENDVFLDNQNGILTTAAPSSTLVIRNSRFEGNGSCVQGCAHGVYAGRMALVRIENSVFIGQHAGHHIKSRALRTELVGNTIEDGPKGDASYLVDIPDGGALVMTRNTLQKGKHTGNPDTAIAIGSESDANATAEIVLKDNRFTNALPRPVVFLRNLSKIAAQLDGNIFSGLVVPVDTSPPKQKH